MVEPCPGEQALHHAELAGVLWLWCGRIARTSSAGLRRAGLLRSSLLGWMATCGGGSVGHSLWWSGPRPASLGLTPRCGGGGKTLVCHLTHPFHLFGFILVSPTPTEPEHARACVEGVDARFVHDDLCLLHWLPQEGPKTCRVSIPQAQNCYIGEALRAGGRVLARALDLHRDWCLCSSAGMRMCRTTRVLAQVLAQLGRHRRGRTWLVAAFCLEGCVVQTLPGMCRARGMCRLYGRHAAQTEPERRQPMVRWDCSWSLLCKGGLWAGLLKDAALPITPELERMVMIGAVSARHWSFAEVGSASDCST